VFDIRIISTVTGKLFFYFLPGTWGPLHSGPPGLCPSCPPHCYPTGHKPSRSVDVPLIPATLLASHKPSSACRTFPAAVRPVHGASTQLNYTAAVNVSLPAFAAERRAVALLMSSSGASRSISPISCPRGTQQQTRRTLLLWSIDRTDRQTDGHPTVT